MKVTIWTMEKWESAFTGISFHTRYLARYLL